MFFLKGIESIEMPIAHAEGRLVVRDEATVQKWSDNNQLALRYCASDDSGVSNEVLKYPINPNGSTANIAGLSDSTGRVLGLMPHPERFLFATQHPQWTRLQLSGEGAGNEIVSQRDRLLRLDTALAKQGQAFKRFLQLNRDKLHFQSTMTSMKDAWSARPLIWA